MLRLKKTNKLLSLTYSLMKLKFSQKRKPVMLSFYITNRCNLRCSYCYIVDEKLPKEFLNAEYTLEEAKKIIDDFYILGTRMVFLVGGEPLVYKYFREIMEYMHKKGMVVHVLTNGILIDKKIEELQYADGICVSLDGVGEVNDCLRGDKVYDRAIANIEKAKSVGMKCRIHSTLTRANLNKFEELAYVAKKMGVTITVSPAHYSEASDERGVDGMGFDVRDEEYREFWKRYLELKKQGYPIGNSEHTIRSMIEWPLGYRDVIMKGSQYLKERKWIECINSKYYVGLQADGTLHYCLKPGMPVGPNIKEMGIKKAWEVIVNNRPNCRTCASTNMMEYSLSAALRWDSILNAIKFQFLIR